jgi:hypothetical protein
MQRSSAVASFTLAAVLIAAAYAAAFLPGGAPAWAPWLVALGSALMIAALMLLGTARSGAPLGRLAWPIAFTFAVVAGGFALALALPGETAGMPLWLGLPPRAAVVLYGIGLVPALVLPLAYALTFDDRTLSDDDLARLREAAAAEPAHVSPGAAA